MRFPGGAGALYTAGIGRPEATMEMNGSQTVCLGDQETKEHAAGRLRCVLKKTHRQEGRMSHL